MSICRRAALATALAIAASGFGSARAEYPERQITLVACFPAGGGTDITARLINTQLGEVLGKPVIVENRGGASGSIGTAAVARAAPDGYTLLICSSAFVVNPSLYAKVSYDPFKDFAPIMVIGSGCSRTVLLTPLAMAPPLLRAKSITLSNMSLGDRRSWRRSILSPMPSRVAWISSSIVSVPGLVLTMVVSLGEW